MDGNTGHKSVLRVFIVEDELVVSLELQALIEDMGFVVAAAAASEPQAMALANSVSFDIAVLDVNLQGKRVDSVAEFLISKNIPLVFATGYGPLGLAQSYSDWPIVMKPYSRDDLEAALKKSHSKNMG